MKVGINSMIKKYFLYLIRWQLSTPILAIVLLWLSDMSTITATIIANFIGGLIFFWVDKFIFKTMSKKPMWEIEDNVVCVDCGKSGRGYRIVEWLIYDRKQDKNPQFRCEKCKETKLQEVKGKIKHRKKYK